MSCKYFTLFLSAFILTLQLLKSKPRQIWLQKTGYQIPPFETLGKVQTHMTASFQPFQPFQPSHIPAHIPSGCDLPAAVVPALGTAAFTRRA